MRLYDCDHCGQTIHFDNRNCVNCGHRLGFVPELLAMHALEQDPGEQSWHLVASPEHQVFFCDNAAMDICNWTVPAGSNQPFCPACRHNRAVPDASTDAGLSQWRRISQAQRHLFYSLLRWDLPHTNRDEDPQGLVFDFLVDEVQLDGTIVPAMTGHEDGLIAIRAAEADDATREQIRVSMNEPYRTMLGHFRHETGHYIWDKLVRDGGRIDEFRAVFGDETIDYGEALRRNYEQGPPPNWQDFYISTYASTHPWEDFAESFAHYLHIVDTLETARAFGMTIEPRRHEEMAAEVGFNPYNAESADQLVSAWIPFSVALNSLHRSLGVPDLYPFILNPSVGAKLEYIHALVHSNRR